MSTTFGAVQQPGSAQAIGFCAAGLLRAWDVSSLDEASAGRGRVEDHSWEGMRGDNSRRDLRAATPDETKAWGWEGGESADRSVGASWC